MLFREKTFICKITKDSNYAIGKSPNFGISFGGIKKGYCYSNRIFDVLKNIGVIPFNAKYIEESSLNDSREIIYSSEKYSSDMSTTIVEYRKVCVPRNIKVNEIPTFIINEIKEYLNPFKIFLQEVKVSIVSANERKPSEEELHKGLWGLADINSSLVTFKNADSSFYCIIGDREYIIAITENNNGVRDFLLLNTDFSNEGLSDYNRLIFNS